MNLEKKRESAPLADLQQWLLDALILPKQVDPSDVERHFLASPHLKATECLALYQRGYILRLTKCLNEQFPALCNALGEVLFERFAAEYLRVHPSDSYTLYELGRRFPDYLDNARPDRDCPTGEREGWIDFMVDLARYERLHFSLFDAPGHEGNPWPTAEVPDEALTLQPCFGLGAYRYPVAWYYHAIRENKKVPFPPPKQSYVALLRQDYRISTFPINQVHYLFLKHLNEHGDIDSALSSVAKNVNRPLDEVKNSWRNEVRARWIQAGFFVKQ